MPWVLLSLLLAVDPPNRPTTQQPQPAPDQAVTFPTKKALEVVQACLTNKLADVGEIAAMNSDEENSTILLVRGNPEGPMVIEIHPTAVSVTTKFISGTREIIKGCV